MRHAAYIAFFLSGASSLIFQNIWSRMLHHVFGATSVAISSVVTAFMAGLGLGAWLAGRYADRIKHPIITYAVAELGVGVWALCIPWLVDPEGWLATVNQYLRTELGAESSGFMLARFALVTPILLVPTTLMGTTLPLLARHFVQAEHRAGATASRVGVLYSVNTFGAVAGINLAGFILLPTIGLASTNLVATSMNFALGIGIILFRRVLLHGAWQPGQKLEWLPTRAPAGEEAAPATDASAAAEGTEPRPASEDGAAPGLEPGPEPAADPAASAEPSAPRRKGSKKKKKAAALDARPAPSAPSRKPTVVEPPLDDVMPIPPIARKLAYFAFAASGAAALCYEVVWSRALAMTIGSSIYSFALILETFLIGIAGGSAVASAFLVRGRHRISVAAVASLLLVCLSSAPWAFEEGAGIYALACGVFIVPILLVWGAVTARSRSVHDSSLVGDRVVPGLVMLAVPVIAAVLNALVVSSHLAAIVAAVTTAIAAFLAVLMALRRYPVLLMALLQLIIALATLSNYVFQDEIPYAFASMVTTIEDLPEQVGTVQFLMFVTAGLCTFPAALGMGAMFPLTIRIWTSGGRAIGRDVGVVYAGNTVGSIVGAWLPGFILMPLIGMERTLHVGMALNLALALMMVVASAAEGPGASKADAAPAKGAPPLKGTAATEGIAATKGTAPGEESGAGRGPREVPAWHSAVVYVLAPLIPALVALLYLGTAHPDSLLRWNLSRMTLGVFRISLAADVLNPETWGEPDIVYYRDGISTTVSVERWGRHYALKNNGKVDASNGDDMPTQIMVAGFPLLMHEAGPEGLDVAVIGFGSGVTVGSALEYPVASVDVIELERSILEASQFFEDVNHLEYPHTSFPFVERDRLRVINDDGRNYLASTDRRYDIVMSEPSNPWITGVSDLFTTDHFRITKRVLEPGGIYCQWVQLYELSPENIKTIYRTFASQFRHVVVFAAEDLSSDTVMLGSDSPLPLDIERLRRPFANPRIAAELERAYIHSPYDVLARTILANRTEVLQYTQLEQRRRGERWVLFPESSNGPGSVCNPADCRREPAPLNTDDNALIEFAAPRDLIGFQRYEGYLANIYSPDWPFGRLVDVATGFGEGDQASRGYAEMAMSLVAHGRKAEAAHFIERSLRAGPVRETFVATEVLELLLDAAAEPQVPIEPPVPGPRMDARTARQLADGFAAVRESIDVQAYGTALAAMEEIPSPLRQHSGPSLRFLYGYLLFKAAEGSPSRYRSAIDQLEDLVRGDEGYVERHPEIYYFLARAHDAEFNFDKALRNMRVYVEARVVPGPGGAELPEPPASEAPTSDEPGEAPKDAHPERT